MLKRTFSLSTLIAICLFCLFVFGPQQILTFVTAHADEGKGVTIQSPQDIDSFEKAIVAETNALRVESHLAPLTQNDLLTLAAQRKADAMAKRGEFAHTLSDGTTAWSLLQQVGYTFRNAGENLAVHFTQSDEVVAAWHNSPTHNANMLSKDFTQIGVGVSRGYFQGAQGYFIVQLFGTPAQ